MHWIRSHFFSSCKPFYVFHAVWFSLFFSFSFSFYFFDWLLFLQCWVLSSYSRLLFFMLSAIVDSILWMDSPNQKTLPHSPSCSLFNWTSWIVFITSILEVCYLKVPTIILLVDVCKTDDNDCADCPSVLTELENIDDEADMFGTSVTICLFTLHIHLLYRGKTKLIRAITNQSHSWHLISKVNSKIIINIMN